MNWAIAYLPARTYQSQKPPPADLGDGQIALNIPDRRVWVGTDSGPVEVTDLQQLIDQWIATVERHTR
ncbi:MAG: hypothetical protein J2P48_11705 [Alphaproteobacteria bacterium]|nr:hypothetical protein [Alphaproteobacteria bacterium]